jgi:uncharacterized damage-inducible protein DinB
MLASEREHLQNYLDWLRETLRWKCAGLTADQLRRRSVPPSSMSLLGLVRHLADVERIWFLVRVGGQPDQPYWKTADNWDADFDEVDGADAAAAFARYEQAVAAAREVAAGRPLEEQYTTTDRRGSTYTFDLRWVHFHMIQEYARHLGHADIVREQVDGVTGA